MIQYLLNHKDTKMVQPQALTRIIDTYFRDSERTMSVAAGT